MTESDDLSAAIERLYGAKATWVRSVPVQESWRGKLVWEGVVGVYDLDGHPKATRCYAWEHLTDHGTRRTVAVLHVPPVDSPKAAVRAAIVAEHREARASDDE